MKILGLLVAVAATAATACPAMAQDSPGLAPSATWTVDYDTDSCALRRMFGEGRDQAYLELRRFGPGAGLQAIVASNRMTARNPATFKYRFDDDAKWNDVIRAPTINMADGFSGVIFIPSLISLPEYDELTDQREREAFLKAIDFTAVEQEAAARTDSMVLRGAFRRELALQIGSLEKPIAALNDCIDELMTHWDIDVEAHKTLTRPAMPIDFAGAARMVGYPPKMARQAMPGLVNVRLAIDETGRISGCRIQMPLSDPDFEASSCADIEHAFEFEPALDKAGKPIPSYWITKVVFQIGR